MADRPRLFIELCARLGSVSLCLQHGVRARPPVSTPGAKTGYAPTILGAAGLYPGQGAGAYLWCEPEAGPRAVLQAYTDPAVLLAAAEVVRGWVGEPARPLWDRLRAEERAEVAAAPERAVARWILLSRWSFSGKGHEAGYGGPGSVVNTERANWTTEQRNEALERPRTAALIEALAQGRWPDVAVLDDARTVDPAEVARWLVRTAGTHGSAVEGGFKGLHLRRPNVDGFIPSRASIADQLEAGAGAWPPVLLGDDARAAEPPADLEGAVVYFDPPYAKTTRYKHHLDRAEVVAIARRWAASGALVIVSEAEAIEELGWEAIEITGSRKGQARTFGATREWLTMSRSPVVRVGVQGSLWAAA